MYEDDIKEAFIKSINQLISNKGHILEDLKLCKDIFDTNELNKDLDAAIENMNNAKDKIEKLIDENSKNSQDQVEYAKKYELLANTFNEEKEKYESINKEIQDKESRKLKYDFFIKKLESLEYLEEFDPLLWNLMLEKMIVNEDGTFEFIYAKGI